MIEYLCRLDDAGSPTGVLQQPLAALESNAEPGCIVQADAEETASIIVAKVTDAIFVNILNFISR